MEYRNLANSLICFLLICISLWLIPAASDFLTKCCTLIGVFWLSGALMKISRKFILYKKVDSEGKAVLITGCDSGFGHTIAKHLDALGFRVFAACLQEDGPGAQELVASCSPKLTVLSMDVTSDSSVTAARDRVTQNLKNDILWAVINNAGILQAGEIDWTPMSVLEQTIQVNTLGTMRVSKAFLSLLRRSKGRLINNTSAIGATICPAIVGYCVSKSAAIAFTTGLRIEMLKWGVTVISIQALFYKTRLTSEDMTNEVIERSWHDAELSTRNDYGEDYLPDFKLKSRRFLERMTSTHVQDVIECFEDAVIAQDPLLVYEPAYLPHKIGNYLLPGLSIGLQDVYKRLHVDFWLKPAALRSKLGQKTD